MSKKEKPLTLLQAFLEKNYPEISSTVVAQILDLVLTHRNMKDFTETMKKIEGYFGSFTSEGGDKML